MTNRNLSLQVQGLDFNDIRENIIEFLKSNPDNVYSDFNFEASGIGTLIDILAMNTHSIGYYVKMALNESYIDSAVLRETLLSKAKLNGYLPKSRRSSRTDVQIQVTIREDQDNSSKTMTIERGSYCVGKNSDLDTRRYYVIDDVVVYSDNRTVWYDEVTGDGMVTYTSPPITVFEGDYETWRFRKDNQALNERFIISDSKIDTETLRVVVKDEIDSFEEEVYSFADSFINVGVDSPIFYLSTASNGYYEIFFGNNKIGKSPNHGQIIEVSFVSTNGPSGDGCRAMTFTPLVDVTGREYTVVSGFSKTAEGSFEESVEDLRFNIPNHYRRQNRLVTTLDYRSFLLNEFKNIESLNVWGGEDNDFKDYNSVYISVKPKGSKKLSAVSQREILKKINQFQVTGRRVKLVDPDYINLNIHIFGSFDALKTTRTSSEIENEIIQVSDEYRDLKLNRFGVDFSDVDFLNFIRTKIPEIKSIYSDKTFQKDYKFTYQINTYHTIPFGNRITPGEVKSSEFTYDNVGVVFVDDANGRVWLKRSTTLKNIFEEPTGTVDYSNGRIQLFLNFDLKGTEDFGDYGAITFSAKPRYPDIKTFLNNILLINSIKVTLEER